MSNHNGNDSEWNCPDCSQPLTGAIVIETGKENGFGEMYFTETPDRNWIQCDACNRIVCKACCLNAQSGYCNGCLSRTGQPAGAQSSRTLLIFFFR